MRLPLAAALAAVVLLVAGCQDTEARMANARLQAELDSLKNQRGGGSDELLKALLVSKNDDTSSTLAELRKNLAAISGDLTSGLKSLNKEVSDNSSDTRKRMEALESKLDKVKELETSLIALKSMVETLEKTVKTVDPNEVLALNKELIQAQADLRAEQIARQAAENRAIAAENARRDAESMLASVKTELDSFKQGKASSLPEYKKLKADYDLLKEQLAKADSDYKALEDLNRRLKESNDLMRAEMIKANLKPPPDVPGTPPISPTPAPAATPKEGDYSFTGKVAKVRSGAKPNAPSLVIVDVVNGEVPPEKAELLVLNAKNEKICRLRVSQHYHVDNDREKAVNGVGCMTIDENPVKPVAEGDKVVWVKPEGSGGKPGAAGGE